MVFGNALSGQGFETTYCVHTHYVYIISVDTIHYDRPSIKE